MKKSMHEIWLQACEPEERRTTKPALRPTLGEISQFLSLLAESERPAAQSAARPIPRFASRAQLRKYLSQKV